VVSIISNYLSRESINDKDNMSELNKKPTITVLICTFNEEKNLPYVFPKNTTMGG